MGTINGLGGTNHALYAFPSRKNPASAPTAPQPAAGRPTNTGQPGAPLAPADNAGRTSATEEFLAYMAMSPAEKIRYSLLNEMGLTEEQLAAMPADERAQIEKKIEELIKERLDVQANEDLHAAPHRPANAFNLALIQQIQAGEERRPAVDIFS